MAENGATRYQVQSEQVRGERRIYWVIDMKRGGEAASRDTYDSRSAENWCAKLNRMQETLDEAGEGVAKHG